MDEIRKPRIRVTDHIHRIFNEYQTYRAEPNAFIRLRNEVVQAVQTFLTEPGILKKYGVPLDGTSMVRYDEKEEYNPISSWIPMPSEENEIRPPGLTNEEFQVMLDELGKIFRSFEKKAIEHRGGSSLLLIHLLEEEVFRIFRETFLKPSENRPFQKGTYVRATFHKLTNEAVLKQNIPCEICGENRAIDVCHIIPSRLRGGKGMGNVLLLCPTHHRLFDRCMLSEEEWNKIDWSRKSKRAQFYVQKVLRIAHKKFWEELKAGNYQKQSPWEVRKLDHNLKIPKEKDL
ncbi:MAG: hypothetical protein AMJ92_05020 [candidate division Zixibacteria bacterium SM23_81]|nr:MAG: hypothetical protein AMJ92_05020 [candidate division Zixibacteria bacterium SM23_81]